MFLQLLFRKRILPVGPWIVFSQLMQSVMHCVWDCTVTAVVRRSTDFSFLLGFGVFSTHVKQLGHLEVEISSWVMDPNYLVACL